LLLAPFTVLMFNAPAEPLSQSATSKWAVVLHGGAGEVERATFTPQREAEYRAGLQTALKTAADVLAKGGTALDAVEAAIRLMEDDPLFNAGRGAVFSAEGRNELDASIMDGADLRCGAVAGIRRTRHPISLARTVMEKSPHVMMAGQGAEAFAAANGLEQVEPAFFFTERRWQSLLRELKKRGLPAPERPVWAPKADAVELIEEPVKYGTVGVVALDRNGNLAAGTSTGGVTAKRYGRVGDTPIIGAGTYASNQSCAVSATGTGEYFIRLTVAREICALVQYKRMGVQAAADEVVQKRLKAIGGDGGVIALSPTGEMAWSFNTNSMYRARLSEGGQAEIGIFKDSP
jgi:beta-aspartyl-peptidase (threonine type)